MQPSASVRGQAQYLTDSPHPSCLVSPGFAGDTNLAELTTQKYRHWHIDTDSRVLA
jgi:hypothetical protein